MTEIGFLLTHDIEEALNRAKYAQINFQIETIQKNEEGLADELKLERDVELCNLYFAVMAVLAEVGITPRVSDE